MLSLCHTLRLTFWEWVIFEIYLHMGSSQAVHSCSDRKQHIPKMAITIQYLAARSKPRSLWNYEINFATKSDKLAVKMRGAMISTFAEEYHEKLLDVQKNN